MDIYSLFMFVAVMLSIIIPNKTINKDKFQDRSNKYYCLILGFLLFIIAAFRATSVGNDSGQYARHFYNLQLVDLRLVISYYQEDFGFYYLAKIITYMTSNHQWMFAVIGGFYSYSISRFIYKHSKHSMVSFVVLITMSYFAFSLTGLKQTIAIAIILFSYDYIIQKKIFGFIICVFIASLFHQSALFFLPAYFISNKQLNTKKVLVGILVVPIIFIFRPLLLNIVQTLLYDTYNIDLDQGAGGWTTLLVYFLIIAVAIIFSKQIKNENFSFFLKMMYVGALIQMFVPLQPNIFRVSMYYNIVSIILIPDIIKTQKDKFSKLIAYSLFFILLGIQYYVFTYYAAGVQPYKFFWQ